jgi:hypothetical protein
VIRDSSGFLMAATCAKLPFDSQKDYLWYSGVFFAHWFALDIGFFYVIFEGSCSSFLTLLGGKERDLTIQDMWMANLYGFDSSISSLDGVFCF